MNNPTTLVVEDDATNRVGLVKLLQYSGLLVDSAETVAAALAKLRSKPRTVLLDVNLPDGTGEEVLSHIRTNDLPSKVCIITGSADTKRIEDLNRFRPDAIFIKPFAPGELLDWVRKAHDPLTR